jgi:cytochrome P450
VVCNARIVIYRELTMVCVNKNTFTVLGHIQNFQFIPFGTGIRVCTGTSLALQVVPTNLATLIQCFEWKVGGNGKVNMEEKPSTILRRAHPLMCVPIPRFNFFSFNE